MDIQHTSSEPVSFYIDNQPAQLVEEASSKKDLKVFSVKGHAVKLKLTWEEDTARQVTRWTPTIEFGQDAQSLRRISRLRLAVLQTDNTEPNGATTLRMVRGGTCQHNGNTRFPTEMFHIEDRELYAHDIARYFDDTGRGSNEYMPIWVVNEAGRGIWLAPEWAGAWSIEVHRIPEYTSVLFELPKVNFVPQPGESIVLPAVVMGRFEGDIQDGSNHFRRYAQEVAIPPFRGERARPRAMFQIFGGPRENMGEPTVHDEVEAVAKLGSETFTYASTWQYDNDPQGKLQWWNLMGDYAPAKKRFPDGMVKLREHLGEKGIDLGLWIDPRIGLNNPLVDEPEVRKHLLFYDPVFDKETTPKYNPISYDINIQPLINLATEGGQKLFRGLLEGMVQKWGAKMIWFDMNCDPRPFFFDVHETADRGGLLEIAWYAGLHKVFADFRLKHPDVWIEVCASGGRILSLATIKMGHSHWITDFTGYDADIAGTILTGANTLLPAVCNHQSWYLSPETQAGGAPELSAFLANFNADLSFAPELYKLSEENIQALSSYVTTWKQYSALLEGDFYLLHPQPDSRADYEAWQIHSEEKGEGLICLRFLSEADATVGIQIRPRKVSASITPSPVLGEADVKWQGEQLCIHVKTDCACLLHYKL